MAKMKYTVNVHFDMATTIVVEAESEADALEYAKNHASSDEAECCDIIDACVTSKEKVD